MVIVALMAALLALAMVEFVRQLLPGWEGSWVVVAAFLAALEAHGSYRLLQQRPLRGVERWRFRLVEVAMLYLLVRLCSLLGQGVAAALAELRQWPRDPLTSLFTLETLAAFVLVYFLWQGSGQTAEELGEVNSTLTLPPEDDGTFPTMSRLTRVHMAPKLVSATATTPREGSAMERLSQRFFGGGTLLLALMALSRLEVLPSSGLAASPWAASLLLLYFLLGFVLLGQLRFATLRRRWQLERVGMAEALPRRWLSYSVLFLGLALLLTFLLPTGYTIGFLAATNYFFGWLVSIVAVLATLLYVLLVFPFAWLIWWFAQRMGQSAPAPAAPPLQFTPPAAPPMESSGNPWLDLARTLLLWAVVVASIVYVSRAYLRDRPEVREAIVAWRPFQWLQRWWRRVKEWGGWLRGQLPQRAEACAAGAEAGPTKFRFFRLGGRSPREQVIFYYLSLLRRAQEQGYPRESAQTPYEYNRSLEPTLPAAQEALDDLTEAFVEARYSRRAINAEEARQAQSRWERLKAALRGVKKG